MRTHVALPIALFFLSVAFSTAACSSSSSSSPANDASSTDTSTLDSASPDTGVSIDSATNEVSDDADASGASDTPPPPPPNKCAHVTCSGSYSACCPSTGACYDTRCSTCCY